MQILTWVMARLKEPSTIGVVAAALGLAGFNIDEGALGEILIGIGALFAVIAAARKEKGDG